MDCPKCKSRHHVKDGIVSGRQRYKCKDCSYRYTVEQKSDVKDLSTRRLALVLYLEGLSFRRIGRILEISYGTVYAWMKVWGENISFLRRERSSKNVELEKILAFVESKKSSKHHGLLLIDLESGQSTVSLLSSR